MNWLKNMSLKTRILAALLLLTVIPMAVNSFLAYNMAKQALIENALIYSQDVADRVMENIEGYQNKLQAVARRAAQNDEVIENLHKEYGGEDAQAASSDFQKDYDQASKYLSSLITPIPGVLEMSICKAGSGYPMMFSSTPRTDIAVDQWDYTKELWYTSVGEASTHEIYLDNVIYENAEGEEIPSMIYAVLIRDERGAAKAVVRVMAAQSMIDGFVQRAGRDKRHEISVTNQYGRIIYDTREDKSASMFLDARLLKPIDSGKNGQILKEDGVSTLAYCNNSASSGWRVFSLMKEEYLTQALGDNGRLFVMIAIIFSVVAVILCYYVAMHIVRPLKWLKNSMDRIEKKNFEDTIVWKYNDEIGDLAASFNRMSMRLKILIARIYEQEAEKRSAEMFALQAQIQPHFLYNTLNAIRYMAIIQKSKGIADMVSALITIMRSVTRTTTGPIPIREEIEWIKSYIFIEETRYCGKFLVDYQIDPQVENDLTIGFILQPIVENAIFHGLEPKEGMGKLTIAIREKQEEGIVEFEVRDDGVGVEQSDIESFMNAELRSKQRRRDVGLYNVNRRLKLNYGDEYGLQIHSQKGEGTQVRIKIPLVREEVSHVQG
ncbi:sensor histidine kinase [Christensenellaceae bacterium NSJ-44]|uniref:histidine kinase n=1 Tax=Luoshenia tenuis TaxID=2763654 RepID=A0A926D349_9FIRM|nr:sensor histidine kinase [Luoshenia tenuis]MBC8530054.1 sensor histidine kinase [Luoshenia tenuis]